MNFSLAHLQLAYGMQQIVICTSFQYKYFNFRNVNSFRSTNTFCFGNHIVSTEKCSFVGYLERAFCFLDSNIIKTMSTEAIFRNTVFESKTTSGDGGAILVSSSVSVFECSQCEFFACSAYNGGAVCSYSTNSSMLRVCFHSCRGTYMGQAYNIESNYFYSELVTTILCSGRSSPGEYSSLRIINSRVECKNLNMSNNYVGKHVPGIFCSSNKDQEYLYVSFDSLDSTETATIDFQQDAKKCNLKYGNIINCPVRAKYSLIFTNSIYSLSFYSFVCYNNTGGSYFFGNYGGPPTFNDSFFDVSGAVLANCVMNNCLFGEKRDPISIDPLNTGRCYFQTKAKPTSQKSTISVRNTGFILLFIMHY